MPILYLFSSVTKEKSPTHLGLLLSCRALYRKKSVLRVPHISKEKVRKTCISSYCVAFHCQDTGKKLSYWVLIFVTVNISLNMDVGNGL